MTLNIASVNANTAFITTMSDYLEFFIERNLDVLLIQEAGPLLDSQLFEFCLNRLQLITHHHPKDNQYNLVILTKFSLLPFIAEIDSEKNCQVIRLLTPFDLTILTLTYNTATRTKTLQFLVS